MEKIALPQFDVKEEDIEYGNCTKYYSGTGEQFRINIESCSDALF